MKGVHMQSFRAILCRIGTVVVFIVMLASCSTINRLNRYSVENSLLRADMQVPPPPTLDVDYTMMVDKENILGTVISVGTTVLKASEAAKARARMEEALSSVDVPGIILEETSRGFASTLSARLVEKGQQADYLLDLNIYKYGIEAPSGASAVSLHLGMNASLYHKVSGKIVWRRKHMTVDIPATPQMFGLEEVLGDIVTVGVLASLTVEELEEGFHRLALESAAWVTRTLQKDYYRARYRR